ncbi:MAG: sulfite exporter TauE/SafE family protein [Chloroflexota bacterium]
MLELLLPYLGFAVLLYVLSFVSGLLGLGVAFLAVPILGLFGFDLKTVIMPWALLLNGVTAISAAVVFLRRGMVDLRTAVPLLVVTTLAAPIGVYLVQFVAVDVIWWIYVVVLAFLAYRLSFPTKVKEVERATVDDRQRVIASVLGVGIGAFAGFLGVGPGFLMMPTLVLLGFTARLAAATNAVVVTLPSFSAFIGHLATAQLDWLLVAITAVAAVAGAQAGAAFTARRIRSETLSRIFAVVLVGLALQRAYLQLLG